jgi:hypothetical protein
MPFVTFVMSAITFRDMGEALFCVNSGTERIPLERFEKFVGTEAIELARTLGFKNSSVRSRWNSIGWRGEDPGFLFT